MRRAFARILEELNFLRFFSSCAFVFADFFGFFELLKRTGPFLVANVTTTIGAASLLVVCRGKKKTVIQGSGSLSLSSASGFFFVTTNGTMQGSLSVSPRSVPSVVIPAERLECVGKEFEHIRRRIARWFYVLAFLQLLFSTLSVYLHANEDTEVFGPPVQNHVEGVVFSLMATLIAGILIILPVSTAMSECKQANTLIMEYSLNGEPMPYKILKQITNANTLLYEHPFYHPHCIHLYTPPPRVQPALPPPMPHPSPLSDDTEDRF
jgi:hypothetical protein